jgi:hypothetical protein
MGGEGRSIRAREVIIGSEVVGRPVCLIVQVNVTACNPTFIHIFYFISSE